MSQLPLYPEKVYHIYNHANGDENLFRCKDNYHYFLRKYAKYIFPVAETYAWCLMPNHYHFMVKIRPESDLQGFQNLGGLKIKKEPHLLVSHQFSKLFNAYSKAFNKMYNRRGSLFQQNFKRKLIDNNAYFTRLIAYIHNNPVYHGFCKQPGNWPYSSWHSLVSEKPTKLARGEVMQWFGNREVFARTHEMLIIKDISCYLE